MVDKPMIAYITLGLIVAAAGAGAYAVCKWRKRRLLECDFFKVGGTD